MGKLTTAVEAMNKSATEIDAAVAKMFQELTTHRAKVREFLGMDNEAAGRDRLLDEINPTGARVKLINALEKKVYASIGSLEGLIKKTDTVLGQYDTKGKETKAKKAANAVKQLAGARKTLVHIKKIRQVNQYLA